MNELNIYRVLDNLKREAEIQDSVYWRQRCEEEEWWERIPGCNWRETFRYRQYTYFISSVLRNPEEGREKSIHPMIIRENGTINWHNRSLLIEYMVNYLIEIKDQKLFRAHVEDLLDAFRYCKRSVLDALNNSKLYPDDFEPFLPVFRILQPKMSFVIKSMTKTYVIPLYQEDTYEKWKERNDPTTIRMIGYMIDFLSKHKCVVHDVKSPSIGSDMKKMTLIKRIYYMASYWDT